ncbi:MAG: enoyl-CoA hydratase/isomerase family protein [Oceanipulchritudo sp.]
MTYQFINYTVDDGVAELIFNRPGQLNAMNRLMMDEIIDALGHINANPQVRAGLITGAGKAFMAGADIKEYAQQTEAEFDAFQTRGRELYAAIEGNAKPVVAAVNGYAFGGGLEIVLACDLVVAAEGAKMGLPEITLGLIPGGGGTQRLPRKIGLNRANELLMTGRSATAEEFRDWGLVNAVFPREEFGTRSGEFVRRLIDKPVAALRVLKQLSRMAAGSMDTAAQAIENEALSRLYKSPEGQECIHAFYRKSLERNKRT